MRNKPILQVSIFDQFAQREIGRELAAMSQWRDHHPVVQGCAKAAIGQDVPVPRSTGMCESGQVMDTRRSAGVCLSADSGFFLPPIAGVTSARYWLWEANTP